jgi:hypothetical protein
MLVSFRESGRFPPHFVPSFNLSFVELRNELTEATSRQIEAEETMKGRGRPQVDGMMTEAEMT